MVDFIKRYVGRNLARGLQHIQWQRLPTVLPTEVPYERTAMEEDVSFFLGTKTGLMYFDGRQLWRLFEGRVYGITQYGGRWYVTWNHPVTLAGKRLSTMASVVSFVFEDGRADDLRVEVAPVDQEVHQIDAWEGHLYVTDTANNRILVYRIGSERLTYVCAHYPSGRLRLGKRSPNYTHINSVYRRGDRVYLMFHNQTRKTGRNSQVASLSLQWTDACTIETDADSAHNVFLDGDVLTYCDSMNGRLVSGGQVVFTTNIYLRGLAATPRHFLVGGSAFAERDLRNTTTGYVYAWDRDRDEPCGCLRIPGAGSIYEIRLIGAVDLAMSGSTEIRKASRLVV